MKTTVRWINNNRKGSFFVFRFVNLESLFTRVWAGVSAIEAGRMCVYWDIPTTENCSRKKTVRPAVGDWANECNENTFDCAIKNITLEYVELERVLQFQQKFKKYTSWENFVIVLFWFLKQKKKYGWSSTYQKKKSSKNVRTKNISKLFLSYSSSYIQNEITKFNHWQFSWERKT